MNDSAIGQITTFIRNNPLAVLSTINDQGDPHGTTLYVGTDDHLNLYLLTKNQTAKYFHMKNHPRVSLTFTAEDHQQTLQVHGNAAEVTVPDEGARAFQVIGAIRHQTTDFRLPISRFEAGPYVVFKIDVSYARLTNYEGSNRVDGISKVEYDGS